MSLWKRLLWFAVAALGTWAVAMLALSRGEHISALWIVTAGFCALSISYRFYSKWLATKVLMLNEQRATPALLQDDNKDYVPTNGWMVFGHHFAAIAGPGPLVGPVLAAQFGFLPGTLWILIGATLGGGVHDMIVLFASIRRGGKTLGQMVREEIGRGVGLLALVSVLAIMIILLAVLALVVVQALAESPWGVFTIATTIPIALVMGIGLRTGKVSVMAVTIFGLLGLAFGVWGGQFLAHFPAIESWFRHDQKWLAWAIMIYGLAASILPVWMLLTPRDYLSTFLKLGTVALLAAAVLLINPTLQMPAITKFIDGSGLVFAGPVFPFVCITIACGAVSGFHSLIASGTTPKMITRESRIRSIGYGAMVTEMMVALMAMIAACVLQPGEYFAINTKGAPTEVVAKVSTAGFPVTEAQMQKLATNLGESTMFNRAGGAPTFAVGMANMFAQVSTKPTALALWYHFAIMFEALFILTTIDAGTRVGRFLLQDFLGNLWRPLGNTRSWTANFFSSVLLVAAWGWFLYEGVIDPLGGINSLWPLFGLANQLLSVVALCLGTTLLIKMRKSKYLFVTLVPLCFMCAVTFSAGYLKVFSPDPRLGFLSGAQSLLSQAAAVTDPVKAANLARQATIWRFDAFVAVSFLVLVLLIVVGSARQWLQLLRGTKRVVLHESEFVQMTPTQLAQF
ncbi:MAG: carbon starvation protein A [Verrucomicrobia bacterium]|nr:MAG: carbon starvation protein A [Verrucomicrobiota bacterium]PYL36252.1 MAG: carbon starvation protein A [Verrucomicrobiota bacterium]